MCNSFSLLLLLPLTVYASKDGHVDGRQMEEASATTATVEQWDVDVETAPRPAPTPAPTLEWRGVDVEWAPRPATPAPTLEWWDVDLEKTGAETTATTPAPTSVPTAAIDHVGSRQMEEASATTTTLEWWDVDVETTGAETTAPTPAPTLAPTADTVAAEYTADETLPSGVTSSDLMSSTVYKDAKKTGLSAALSIAVSDITITGFTVNARRLSAAVRELSATVSVTTSFEVQVADASAAEALTITIAGAADDIKTQTNIAIAAADWSDEPVITAAPTVNDVTDVTIPTVVTFVQTVVVAPVPAGATELEVLSQDGFAVGDTVVISGGGNSETRSIAGFGSIVLDSPLEYPYPAGSSITKQDASWDPSGEPTTTSAADDGFPIALTVGVSAALTSLFWLCAGIVAVALWLRCQRPRESSDVVVDADAAAEGPSGCQRDLDAGPEGGGLPGLLGARADGKPPAVHDADCELGEGPPRSPPSRPSTPRSASSRGRTTESRTLASSTGSDHEVLGEHPALPLAPMAARGAARRASHSPSAPGCMLLRVPGAHGGGLVSPTASGESGIHPDAYSRAAMLEESLRGLCQDAFASEQGSDHGVALAVSVIPWSVPGSPASLRMPSPVPAGLRASSLSSQRSADLPPVREDPSPRRSTQRSLEELPSVPTSSLPQRMTATSEFEV